MAQRSGRVERAAMAKGPALRLRVPRRREQGDVDADVDAASVVPSDLAGDEFLQEMKRAADSGRLKDAAEAAALKTRSLLAYLELHSPKLILDKMSMGGKECRVSLAALRAESSLSPRRRRRKEQQLATVAERNAAFTGAGVPAKFLPASRRVGYSVRLEPRRISMMKHNFRSAPAQEGDEAAAGSPHPASPRARIAAARAQRMRSRAFAQADAPFGVKAQARRPNAESELAARAREAMAVVDGGGEPARVLHEAFVSAKEGKQWLTCTAFAKWARRTGLAPLVGSNVLDVRFSAAVSAMPPPMDTYSPKGTLDQNAFVGLMCDLAVRGAAALVACAEPARARGHEEEEEDDDELGPARAVAALVALLRAGGRGGGEPAAARASGASEGGPAVPSGAHGAYDTAVTDVLCHPAVWAEFEPWERPLRQIFSFYARVSPSWDGSGGPTARPRDWSEAHQLNATLSERELCTLLMDFEVYPRFITRTELGRLFALANGPARPSAWAKLAGGGHARRDSALGGAQIGSLTFTEFLEVLGRIAAAVDASRYAPTGAARPAHFAPRGSEEAARASCARLEAAARLAAEEEWERGTSTFAFDAVAASELRHAGVIAADDILAARTMWSTARGGVSPHHTLDGGLGHRNRAGGGALPLGSLVPPTVVRLRPESTRERIDRKLDKARAAAAPVAVRTLPTRLQTARARMVYTPASTAASVRDETRLTHSMSARSSRSVDAACYTL